jgi:hypothetical protein
MYQTNATIPADEFRFGKKRLIDRRGGYRDEEYVTIVMVNENEKSKEVFAREDDLR